VLVFLAAEIGRARLRGYLNTPWLVRWGLYLLTILFASRAWRIWTGYGEADVSEVLLYSGLIACLVLIVGLMVRRAWSERLDRAPLDALPVIKEACARPRRRPSLAGCRI
jgi:hypothetical protein